MKYFYIPALSQRHMDMEILFKVLKNIFKYSIDNNFIIIHHSQVVM